MRKARLTIGFGVRARILVIALIPSLALFALGFGGAWYLVDRGEHAREWSAQIQRGAAPGVELIVAVQQERSLSLLRVAGASVNQTELQSQRRRVDDAVRSLAAIGNAYAKVGSDEYADLQKSFASTFTRIAAVRTQLDADVLPAAQTDEFYSTLIGIGLAASQSAESGGPDARTAVNLVTATTLARVAEAMSHGNAIALAAVVAGGLTPEQLIAYGRLVGYYHTEIEALASKLTPEEQKQLGALTGGTAWKQLERVEHIVLQNGSNSRSTSAELSPDVSEWRSAAAEVSAGLLGLWRSHLQYAVRFAADSGAKVKQNSLLGGIGMALVAVIAFGVALWLSNHLIRRLESLRDHTLNLAHDELPTILRRLQSGNPAAVDIELSELDFGRDEIGQVAAAFNSANRAALDAAIAESRTREGVKAVFLNIAHRTQMVVHQQLALLDRAEHEQQDPDLLALLFQLDQLATRGRRNAENLIILGGERPGRQWRNPVALIEIVRSATGETEEYARVRTGRLPDIRVVGTVVADLIHLLAELVENATVFSPPQSQVEVVGGVVGKGVVVEIVDQGLGISPEQLGVINETLQNPPDFDVSVLSGDSRLGIFVVARLAARHGIRVRLVESEYGGVRAVVLVPLALIADRATENDGRPAPTLSEVWIPQPAPVTDVLPQPPAAPVVDIPDYPPGMPDYLPRTAAELEEPRTPPSTATPHGANRTASRYSDDDRPPLPRRNRQASLAPELAGAGPDPEADPKFPSQVRSSEEVRTLWAAIESGTKRGRYQASPGEPERTTHIDGREGYDDQFPHH
ncbi:nitrate- and nitrite sensing domain-containing protein [Nocardia sp. NPDC052278]|uniref:nitrate- and nitrite sensing domain-containing protein n=1 Tax=unclassified Nocardia TaxID=2637762 RepID=UPI0036C315A4